MDVLWTLGDGRLTHEGLPEPLTGSYIQQPYPPFWWYVQGTRLITEDLPNRIDLYMSYPYPPFWWYLDTTINKLKNSGLPSVSKMGAFCNCANLQTATIPKNVKYIGDFAFNDTGLTEVTIASDCTYKDTSFPDNCTINTYPD